MATQEISKRFEATRSQCNGIVKTLRMAMLMTVLPDQLQNRNKMSKVDHKNKTEKLRAGRVARCHAARTFCSKAV